MNMRLRELMKSKESKSADVLQLVTELNTEQPKPGIRMSNLTMLASKVTKARKIMQERAANIASRNEQLELRAGAVLDQHEAELTATEQEIQELESSLNTDIGHNGGPQ